MPFLPGYRLLDMAWMGPGPFCSQILANLGVDVIKITEVSRGAGRRGGREMRPMMLFHEPPKETRSAGRRHARTLGVDLKTEGGQAIFRRLVEKADAVQEGFRPGVADRLGVGYEAVRATKPDIVYASISGYGQDGPYANRVGHDLNYLSIAGFIDMNGRAGGPPAIPGTVIADFAAGGMSAAIHILAGLLRRQATGEGTYADVSMTDAVFEVNSMMINGHLSSGIQPRRGQTMTSGFWPFYDVYETSDGRWVSVAAMEPWFYEALCKTLGRDDLAGEQWSLERREQTKQDFAAVFKSRTREEWVRAFEGVEACFAPVNSTSEAVADPQMRARRMVVDAVDSEGRPVQRMGSMLKFHGQSAEAEPPQTSQEADAEAILAEHGYSPGDIEQLRRDQIVA